MEDTHINIENKLLESLVEIQQAVKILGFDRELYDSAEKCKKLINDKQYNVAVMGGFNCGKSSIINALLGTKILPTYAVPTTAAINRIKYGEEKVVIRFQGGGEKEIGINEMEEYVTKLTSDKEENAAKVEEAVVYYPTQYCKNNIDIIDTPGLNDSKDMTAITKRMLRSVDAVIMPIHPKVGFGKWETDFVCDLISAGGINNVVFVVNFLDKLEKDDYEEFKEYVNNLTQTDAKNSTEKPDKDDYFYVMEYVKKRIQTKVIDKLEETKSGEDLIAKAHLLLDNMKVCGISAKLALSKNPQERKESRFEEFEIFLQKSLTLKQKDNVSNKTINSMKFIASEFESQDKKRRDYFKNKAEEIQSIESAISGYADDFDKFINNSVFGIDYDNELEKVLREIEEYKQLIKEIFINELYEVRENTNERIRAALEKARDNAVRTVRQKAPNKRIFEIFLMSAGRLIDYKKKKLDGLFERLSNSRFDIIGSEGHISTSSLTDFAGNALSKNEIDLSGSSRPEISDWTNINVIKAVTNTVNYSVDKYIRELNKAAREIRVNWDKQFDEDKERTQSTINKVDKEIKEQKKELEDEKTAYEYNYKGFKESPRKILSECQKIRAENI